MILAQIPNEIQQDARLLAAVEAGNLVLEDVLRKEPFGVRASWSIGADAKGSPGLVLTLEEKKAGSLSRRIDLKDFDNEDRLWFRISRPWQDLLSMRMDRTMENLEILIGSEDAS